MEIVKLFCTPGNKSMHNYSVEVILEAFLYLQCFIHVKKWKNMLFMIFFKVSQTHLYRAIEILCTSLWSKDLKSLIAIHHLSCTPKLQSTPSLPCVLFLNSDMLLFPFNAEGSRQIDAYTNSIKDVQTGNRFVKFKATRWSTDDTMKSNIDLQDF